MTSLEQKLNEAPFLLRWLSLIDEVCQGTRAAPERANAVAEALHELVPAADWTACRLDDRKESTLAVHPQGNAEARKQAEQRHGMAVPVEWNNHAWGFLLVGLPAGGEAFHRQDLEELLRCAAQTLAIRLQVEADRGMLEILRQERRDDNELILVGEATLGLFHGLNNSLNSMLLQAAVVEMKVDQGLRPDVAQIRHEGAEAAARLRPVLKFRERRRQARAAVDLNEVVQAVADDLENAGTKVAVDLAAALPTLQVPRQDLKRLVKLLVGQALKEHSKLTAATKTGAGAVQFVLGPVSEECFAGIKETEDTPLDRDTELAALALRFLMLHVEAELATEPGESGGLQAVVTWKTT